MLQQFLQCTDIELRIRRPVFLNLVYNTFLSGLEPEQVSFTDLKACDNEMMVYMKKMLQLQASDLGGSEYWGEEVAIERADP